SAELDISDRSADLRDLGGALVGRFSRGGRRQRHPLDDLETVARKAHEPARMVGHEGALADPEVTQNLCTDPVGAKLVQTETGIGARRAARLLAGGEEI